MYAAKRFCVTPGCPELVSGGGHCEKHRKQRGKTLRDSGQTDKRYFSSRWQRLRAEVMAEGDGFCVHCAKREIRTAAVLVDHVIPAWVEGVDFFDKSNLAVSCARCNRTKVDSDARTYRRGVPAGPSNPWVIG